MDSKVGTIRTMGDSFAPNKHPTTSSATQLELKRMQAFKTIKAKFYIHKSFDIQSDMEFLPAIPSETSTTSSYPPLQGQASSISPTMQYNEYYRSPMAYQSMDDAIATPKSRMAYMNQASPKRGSHGLRKRVVSNSQQQQHQQQQQQLASPASHNSNTHSNMENYVDQSYLMHNRMGQLNSQRNW